MYCNLLTTRLIVTFTASRGNSLGLLSDGGSNWGRRILNHLVPASSYDDDLPEPPLPPERPFKNPEDVPARNPADVPVREPHDVPPPPSEPPFPRPPQPASPPERSPEAWLGDWLEEQRRKRTRGRTGSTNQGRRRSDR